jgi:type I restriction enzyme S subunit
MAGEWRIAVLGDLTINHDGKRKPVKESDRRPGPYPYYGASGIVDYVDGYLFDGEYLLVAEDGENLRTRQTPIAFMARGKSWVNNHAHVLTGNDKADTRFLMYAIEGTDISGYLTGAVMPKLTQGNLNKIELNCPPLAEQRAIAHILGTLDDKIELNRKQNETLEAMARALFKAWFVDFEPVRAKMEGRWQRGQSLLGMPAHLYDLFPDRLVESELGEIPEGWRVFSFSDVAQQGKGAVNPTDEAGERFTHYSIPAFDAGKMPVIELGGSIKSNKTLVPDGAVLVSKLNPHIPRVWLVGQAGNRAVCSTEFIVWTPKSPANSAFLYCLASSSEFVDYMCQLVTGTSNSHQRVKPDQLREIRVCAASDNVIDAFSEIVESLMDQVLQNGQQSKNLAQLRGALLPKLISGELRIADAKAFLKERGL